MTRCGHRGALAVVNLLFATSNPHKLEEVRAILGSRLEVVGLDSLERLPPEPVEDGVTFAQNATIKAQAYARATGRRCLAEDSGLEVDALGGAPGVHSARFAGTSGSRAERDRANNAKLIELMTQVPPERRAARFVCAMCVADPDGTIVATAEGYFPGRITVEPRGENGFGYDPLLYLPELSCTSAELLPAEKNARSHRAQAARKLVLLL